MLKRIRRFIKSWVELRFWKKRKSSEIILSNAHYEYFYTGYFHLDRQFYKDKKILDIGCGPRGSLEWADMASERVGLDPLVEKYRSLGINKHKMKYVSACAEKIPFPDEYFDILSSFNSLDHVDNLEQTVKSITRVIKQGGLFLLITELNHPPTFTESTLFSWDVSQLFSSALSVIEENHYEKTSEGIYESVCQKAPYDHLNKQSRAGILSVKFIKKTQA